MSQEQAKQFLDQAAQSLQSGQFGQALELIDQAIALSPGDAEAHILRGICLAQTNRPQEATDAFKKAVGLSPYNAKAYYNLAVHYYSLGQKHEALSMAQEASTVDPRHSAARELVTRIQNETRADQQASGPGHTNVPASPMDVLKEEPTLTSQTGAPSQTVPSPGTAPSMPPPPGTGGPYTPPGAPASNPGMGGPTPPPAGGVPGQYPPAQQPYAPGYMRPGYEPQPIHTLPFVERMGGGWAAIGWTLAALSLIMFFVNMAAGMAMFRGLGSGAVSVQEMSRMQNPTVAILGYIIIFGIWTWTTLDLVDRRGNFLWLVPQVLCGCCGLGFITLPVYMLAGRK